MIEEEGMLERPKPTVKEAPVENSAREDVLAEISKIDAGKIEPQKVPEQELSKWNKENVEIARKLGEKKKEEQTEEPKERPKDEINIDLESPEDSRRIMYGDNYAVELPDFPLPPMQDSKEGVVEKKHDEQPKLSLDIPEYGRPEAINAGFPCTYDFPRDGQVSEDSNAAEKLETKRELDLIKTLVAEMSEKAGATLASPLTKEKDAEKTLEATVEKDPTTKEVQKAKFSEAEIANYSFIVLAEMIEKQEELNKKQAKELITELEQLFPERTQEALKTTSVPVEIIAQFSDDRVLYYEDEKAYLEHKPYIKLNTDAITKKLEEVKAKFSNETKEDKTLEATVEKELSKEALPIQDECSGKTTTGNYEIIGVIGKGSCGVLYEAEAAITGKKVVLKTSNNKDFDKGNDHIIGEAMVHKSLQHPNIVQIEQIVYDAEKRVYAQMPFMNGAKKLVVSEKRSLKGIAQIAKTLAEAYDYAHKQGVLHRDIKPDNILIGENGVPYIIDFGVAKVTDKETIARLRNSLGETSFTDAEKAGTPKYMAPEILEGDAEPSQSTEVYSLGKVMYHMLMQTDKATPIGDVKKQLMGKTAKLDISKIHQTRLAEIVAKATSDAENRYKSMEDFVKDLENLGSFLTDKVVESVEPSKEVQKNNVGGFFITEDGEYYHLHNVSLDGKLQDHSWTKKLLNDGKPATQGEHVENTKDKKEKLASLPVYNASITAVVKHKKNSVGGQKELADKVCRMFADDFKHSWVMTGTRVFTGSVVHDYGYLDAETISARVRAGLIKENCGLEDVTQTLFKTRNCAEIEQTYEELIGKPYFQVAGSDVGAVVLGRDVVIGFNIICNDDISSIRPARGVVISKKSLEEKIDATVPQKNSYTSVSLSCTRERGVVNFDKEDFLMTASEYATIIHNIAQAFGKSVRISFVKTMRGRLKRCEDQIIKSSSFREIYASPNEYVLLYTYYDNFETDSTMARILFELDDSIKGNISFNYLRFNAEILETKITDSNKELIDALTYFHKSFKKKQWFSPKKELEEKGFTLEYAIDLFDNNRFRSPEVKFEKGKQLYALTGAFLGYATADIIDNKPRIFYFNEGRIFKGKELVYRRDNLIDLGDVYLLKP